MTHRLTAVFAGVADQAIAAWGQSALFGDVRRRRDELTQQGALSRRRRFPDIGKVLTRDDKDVVRGLRIDVLNATTSLSS